MSFLADFPNIPSLNPLSYLQDAIVGGLKGLTGVFEQVFVRPPVVPNNAATDYLYGNAIGTTGKLAVSVAFVATAIAIFWRKAAHKALNAFIAIVALAVLTPVWFYLSDWLIGVGNSLAEAALFYHPPPGSHTSGSFLPVPAMTNIAGAISGGSIMLLLGSVLVGVFYTYAVFIVVVKFSLLFGIALAGISPRLLKWIIAGGLVAMVFGRAAAILMIELSKVAADNGLYGDTVFGIVFYLIVGLLLALGAQYGLYKGMKQVVTSVAGNVKSRVTGTVKSVQKRISAEKSAALARQAHHNSMPVQVSMTKKVTKTTRDQVIIAGARKVGGAKVAAAAGPEAAVIAAAAVMAKKAYDRRQSRST